MAHITANGHSADTEALASAIARKQLDAAKNDLLALTECQPDEWDGIGSKFAVLAETWRETRSVDCLAMVDERFTETTLT